MKKGILKRRPLGSKAVPGGELSARPSSVKKVRFTLPRDTLNNVAAAYRPANDVVVTPARSFESYEYDSGRGPVALFKLGNSSLDQTGINELRQRLVQAHSSLGTSSQNIGNLLLQSESSQSNDLQSVLDQLNTEFPDVFSVQTPEPQLGAASSSTVQTVLVSLNTHALSKAAGIRRMARRANDSAKISGWAGTLATDYDLSANRLSDSWIGTANYKPLSFVQSMLYLYNVSVPGKGGELMALKRKQFGNAEAAASMPPVLAETLPSSEVLFGLYRKIESTRALQENSGDGSLKPLTRFSSVDINNPQTLDILSQCTTDSAGKGTCSPSTTNSDDFWALLGTPNLSAAVALLKDHGTELGIDSIENLEYRIAGHDSQIHVTFGLREDNGENS